jgi:hypothetical protein
MGVMDIMAILWLCIIQIIIIIIIIPGIAPILWTIIRRTGIIITAIMLQRVPRTDHQTVRQEELRHRLSRLIAGELRHPIVGQEELRLQLNHPIVDQEELRRLHNPPTVNQEDLLPLRVPQVQIILPSVPDPLPQEHPATEAVDIAVATVGEVPGAAAVIAAAVPGAVAASAAAQEVAEAAAEDANPYLRGISDALISLTHTYLPSLFSNRLI